jgi:sugar/nucleoside kinase (ribokinase family)
MQYDYVSMGFYTFDALAWPVSGIPPGGGTHFVEDFALAVSGAAGTAVIAAAKMGLRCLAVGGVGEDLMGDWVLARVASFGVDTVGLQRIPGARTSSSLVLTRADGSRPALHLRGATRDFAVEGALLDRATDARIVHLGGVGLMDRMDGAPNAALMRLAKAKGAITTVDVFATSPEDMADVAAVLPFTDYFLPSDEEALALSGLTGLDDAAHFFLDRGVKVCCFTRGAEGAAWYGADGTRFRMPAFAVDVRCTCGCGDAFNAGFATGLLKGMDPEETVRFAQATSALNATGLGSQAGVRSFADTLDFIARTPLRKAG